MMYVNDYNIYIDEGITSKILYSMYSSDLNKAPGAIMDIITRKEGKVVIVSVRGRMDAVTSLDFEKSMSALISAGGNIFVISLNQMDFISSSGLRSILRVAKQLKPSGGKLLFANLQDTVKDVFKISGFSTIFAIYETEEEALKA
jgi:anti-anti-sigma factor